MYNYRKNQKCLTLSNPVSRTSERNMVDYVISLSICNNIELSNVHFYYAVLSTKPFEVAINEAKSLFDYYSQDLVNVAKNAYEPYSYFEASEKNSCKKSIDEKKIPIGKENLVICSLKSIYCRRNYSTW